MSGAGSLRTTVPAAMSGRPAHRPCYDALASSPTGRDRI
jgi:hypothetical protein